MSTYRNREPRTREEAAYSKHGRRKMEEQAADALQAKLDEALGLHEGDFYEEDEDPEEPFARFDEAMERGEHVVVTAPPEDDTITDNVAWVLWLAAERGELRIPEETE